MVKTCDAKNVLSVTCHGSKIRILLNDICINKRENLRVLEVGEGGATYNFCHCY